MVDVAKAAERGRQVSSRKSEGGAGWQCEQIGTFAALVPGDHSFTWLNPRTLWRSRNEILAHLFGDPSHDARRRWMAALRDREPGETDFRIDRRDLGANFSFLVLGDTGEGDASQYAVVPGMLKIGQGTGFAIIASDVVYPAGSGNEYEDKFFRPYQDYPAPIYAVPGNHDWYDGLGGFMRVFCGLPTVPGLAPRGLRGLLWRKPEKIDEARLAEAAKRRSRPEQRSRQPGPYWVIELANLLVVGIDTGITNGIDADQGAWLRRVSADPRPKVLVTGRPIYVNNTYQPCPIEGGGTVDDIVRDPAHRYVAAIGGDIHNYQRYPVKVGDRVIQYVVSGGGGAFTHATHTIPRVDVGGVAEDAFKCYPLRGDSLSFYSLQYSRRLRMRWLYLTPEQSLAITAARIGNNPPRPTGPPPRITRRMRWAARLLGAWPFPFHLPVGRFFHHYISELSDWDTPPFFKSFLHLSVTPGELRIRCFAATGCLAQELEPPLEDEAVIPLTGL